MNLWNPEQNAVIQQANTEASFALANKTVEIFQKVIELNLKTARSSIAETKEVMLKALSGDSPQEWSKPHSGAAELIVPQIHSYFSQLIAIASNSQLEIANIANDHFVGQQQKLQELIDGAAQYAPAAAETATSALKSAISAAGAWYETTRKASQQTILTAENNAEAVSAAVSRTTRQAVERASRATSK